MSMNNPRAQRSRSEAGRACSIFFRSDASLGLNDRLAANLSEISREGSDARIFKSQEGTEAARESKRAINRFSFRTTHLRPRSFNTYSQRSCYFGFMSRKPLDLIVRIFKTMWSLSPSKYLSHAFNLS